MKCAKDKEEIEWVKEQMDLSWFIETRLWYYTCDWSRNAEQKKWYLKKKPVLIQNPYLFC